VIEKPAVDEELFWRARKSSRQRIVASIQSVLNRVSGSSIVGFWYVGCVVKKFIAHLVAVTTRRTITIAAAKITDGQKFGQTGSVRHTISPKLRSRQR